ncbi:MAG TPA: IPT/TIG domain-containing protein [Anaeromyxobacter sp.]|nr:IPT/TIG domain-containing protein [Anaeromyxobacter sp.]
MRLPVALALAASVLVVSRALAESDEVPPQPLVARVSPSAGPPGTRVTIRGNNFLPGATVSLGGVEAAVERVTDTTVVATAGPHSPGRVSVEVRNPNDARGVRGWAFTYLPPPAKAP